MQITIHVREAELGTLSRFLGATTPFDHDIEFYTDKFFLSFPVVEVHVSYNQYISLTDWKIKTNEDPSL